ncbi:alpha/beta hydrolase [Pontiellaceae bacterium B12227]|nr:alpha/beta hydrolase [Pontiellaceae bacterium B12227]
MAIVALMQIAFALDGHPVVPLWPPGTANVNPDVPEKVSADKKRYSNIQNPSLTVFKPENPNGTAVIICPGGGYQIEACGVVGWPVAKVLNESGITAFVLKYRLPTTKNVDFKHPVPLSDALRAIQLVRHRAAEFGVDSDRIGIMGFSAGGHLAACAGTLHSAYRFGVDEISKVSSRPDFMALVFPVISTQKNLAHGCIHLPLSSECSPRQRTEMSCEQNVNATTPPTFLAHAKDDTTVPYGNSVVMHEALKKQGVSTELILYEKGGHGFGLGRAGTDSTQWPGDFICWLQEVGILN